MASLRFWKINVCANDWYRERYLLQHSSMFGVESVVQMLLQQGGSPTSDDIEEASEAGHGTVVVGVERLTPRALELATLMNHCAVITGIWCTTNAIGSF